MRRAVVLSTAVLTLLLGASAASATPSGIRGTVFDSTCAVGCEVPCPPPPSCRTARICLQPDGAAIVCPQSRISALLPYAGENAHVIVRRKGSATILARISPREGRFSLRLAPGHYIVRAYVSEECWSGERRGVAVSPGRYSALALDVWDGCVAHPDTAKGDSAS